MRGSRGDCVLVLAALSLVAPATGCRRSPSELYGYNLDVPSGWEPMDQKDVVVPGRPLQAWSIPGGGNMVVFKQIRGSISAEQLLTLTFNQSSNQPGWTIDEYAVRKIDGLDAMWIVITGWGDGASLVPTPTGEEPRNPEEDKLVRTRRLWLGVLRPYDVLGIQIHYREDRHAELRPVVDKLLGSLRWGDDERAG